MEKSLQTETNNQNIAEETEFAPLLFVERGRVEHPDNFKEDGQWFVANRELWYYVPETEDIYEIPLGLFLLLEDIPLIPWNIRSAERFLYKYKSHVQFRAYITYPEVMEWHWERLFLPEYNHFGTDTWDITDQQEEDTNHV